MRLVDRDYVVFQEVERWRFCLGRHIKVLAGFTGQRACDRRLKALIDAGYIEREKVLYGVPSIYKLTYKAKMLIGTNKRQDKIRVDNIAHDIAVIDTAIYFNTHYQIPLNEIMTEKQLHSRDGFSIRKHQPDFIFTKNGNVYCVEVELSLKSSERLERNIKSNFGLYDTQIWAIEDLRLFSALSDNKRQYPNIIIINIEEVKKYVRKIN